MKRKGLVIGIVLFVLITYYITLPPLNLSSPAFWGFVLETAIYIFGLNHALNIIEKQDAKIFNLSIKKRTANLRIFLGLIIIFASILLLNLINSPLFMAKSYAKRINVIENNTFIDDVYEVDFSHIPLLDKDSSIKLGDRVMGQLPEMVSQFDVSSLYTQINYKDEIVRVTPLEYNGFIKYLTNRQKGTAGYIIVNSTTGETSLKRLDKGLKYMPSAYFNEDLMRVLRFKYPTAIFDTPSFEIDNEGTPFWIVPSLKYTAVGLKKEVKSIIILNAVTGKTEEYKINNIPNWIDHVYSADLILDQLTNWGIYKNGFLNSLFGQKNVVAPSKGYNYMVMNDDVYLYTGITSVIADEANIGFVLVNLRTKETKFYGVPGAEEFSAMASAEGQVQHLKYNASFPLLINLNETPTYLMSLKDNAGLVKMYAFVDVKDYQKVVVTDASETIHVAARNYLKEYTDDTKNLEESITISSITSAIINNNTYYYLIDENLYRYRVNINVAENVLPFLKIGDKIMISYIDVQNIREIISLK